MRWGIRFLLVGSLFLLLPTHPSVWAGCEGGCEIDPGNLPCGAVCVEQGWVVVCSLIPQSKPECNVATQFRCPERPPQSTEPLHWSPSTPGPQAWAVVEFPGVFARQHARILVASSPSWAERELADFLNNVYPRFTTQPRPWLSRRLMLVRPAGPCVKARAIWNTKSIPALADRVQDVEIFFYAVASRTGTIHDVTVLYTPKPEQAGFLKQWIRNHLVVYADENDRELSFYGYLRVTRNGQMGYILGGAALVP